RHRAHPVARVRAAVVRLAGRLHPPGRGWRGPHPGRGCPVSLARFNLKRAMEADDAITAADRVVRGMECLRYDGDTERTCEDDMSEWRRDRQSEQPVTLEQALAADSPPPICVRCRTLVRLDQARECIAAYCAKQALDWAEEGGEM